jgi:hypothetical protein
MFEFDANYDTGTLDGIAIGSGVHLNKDVTFYFSILDNKSNLIENTQSFRSNAFVKDATFDVLDIGGNTILPEYLTSANISLTFDEAENKSIFGEYQKDFGIRAKISNNFNPEIYVSEYYVYGNVPEISGIKVIDGSGYKNYSITGSVETDESINKIQEGINFNISLQNDARYIKLQKVEFYVVESETASLPQINLDNLIQSSNIFEFADLNNINLNKSQGIEYYTNYNFAIVPYSTLGSGKPFYIENIYFAQTPQINESTIISPIIDTVEITKIESLTGVIPTRDKYIIDIFEKSNYKTVSYLTQIVDAYGSVTSSDLKVTISESTNQGKSGIFINEYAINNDIGIEYLFENTNSYIYLSVLNVEPTGFFRIQRTAI